MATFPYDRVSLSLALESLGEGAGGAGGEAVDGRAAVFKPDGARFSHAATTVKLGAGAMYALALSAKARKRGRCETRACPPALSASAAPCLATSSGADKCTHSPICLLARAMTAPTHAAAHGMHST